MSAFEGAESGTMSELDARRRRALWRASHRGTKEMDLMLGAYARAELARMDAARLARFEALLALPDPDLNAWILQPALIDGSDFSADIGALRRFHGLDRRAD